MVSKGQPLADQSRPPRQESYLADAAPLLEEALASLHEMRAAERMWGHDGTLWRTAEATVAKIERRLGWLELPTLMVVEIGRLYALQAVLEARGYRHVVLLGMGGSSLAAVVLGAVADPAEGSPDLIVLDTTDPTEIRVVSEACPPGETIYIVSSKSGSTAETMALYALFRKQAQEALGEAEWSHRFVVVTDPDSPLEHLAEGEGIEAVYLNPPDVGGRYSAFSFFGLVPAALLGVDLDRLLARGQEMARACRVSVGSSDNPALALGAIMGVLATKAEPRRDKVSVFTSPHVHPLGAWIEQLLAESTGKEGRGLIPVVDWPVPEAYSGGNDRLWVYIRLDGDDNVASDRFIDQVKEAGDPYVILRLRDRYDVGREFFRWEFATAVAGRLLNVNPFDQPNVEAAKKQARAALDAYIEAGALPEQEPSLVAQPLTVYGAEENPGSVSAALRQFLAERREGDYVALLAYVDRSPDNVSAVHQIASHIETSLGLPTTVGFGPRYLHSTGQLHKGGPASVLAIEITAQSSVDLKVPDAGYTFGLLKKAQALGDQAALRESNRRVMRVDIGSDVAVGLEALAGAVAQAVREASE